MREESKVRISMSKMRGKITEVRINKSHGKKGCLVRIVVCYGSISCANVASSGVKEKVGLKCVRKDTRRLKETPAAKPELMSSSPRTRVVEGKNEQLPKVVL